MYVWIHDEMSTSGRCRESRCVFLMHPTVSVFVFFSSAPSAALKPSEYLMPLIALETTFQLSTLNMSRVKSCQLSIYQCQTNKHCIYESYIYMYPPFQEPSPGSKVPSMQSQHLWRTNNLRSQMIESSKTNQTHQFWDGNAWTWARRAHGSLQKGWTRLDLQLESRPKSFPTPKSG